MPIRSSIPVPPVTRQALARQLRRFWREGHLLAAAAGAPAAASLNVTDAYRVYGVGLEDLAAGRLLVAAQPRHWRHLLLVQEQAVAEADVHIDAEGKSQLVAVHHGPSAGGTARALEALTAQQALEEEDYELRAIEAPGVYFVALWLAGQTRQLLVPIEPDRSSLPLYQPLTEEQVLAVLTPKAAAVLAMQRGDARHLGG